MSFLPYLFHPCVRALSLFLSVILSSPTALASIYVPLSDAALSAQAEYIAVGSIVSVEAGPNAKSQTDYRFQVHDNIRGSLPRIITVRVAGTLNPKDGGRIIRGMPRFQVNDEALLFLGQRADGSFGITHYFLGAFHSALLSDGERGWIRDLRETQAIATKSSHSPPPGTRHGTAFLNWLRSGATGAESYWTPAKPTIAAAEKFTALVADTPWGSATFRWFDFDEGHSVSWVAHPDGYINRNGYGGNGFSAFVDALEAWNNAGGSIAYTYRGVMNATGGLTESDGYNSILWEDPNDEISGRYVCGEGGTLAIGGPYGRGVSSGGLDTFNGQDYLRIFEADIVIQDGAGCVLDGSNGLHGAETFAHELGHTLGFGHACDDSGAPDCSSSAWLEDALMNPTIHGGNRGARLGSDDIDAVMTVYPTSESGTPQLPGIDLPPISTLLGDLLTLELSENLQGLQSFFAELRVSTGRFNETIELRASSLYQSPQLTLPFGVLVLKIDNLAPGDTTELVLELPSPYAADTPLYCEGNQCTLYPVANVSASGQQLHWFLTDGGEGDLDGQADGQIVTQVAAAQWEKAAPKPASKGSGRFDSLLLLMLLLAHRQKQRYKPVR